MKAMILRMVLPIIIDAVMDLVVEGLKRLAGNTSSKIDDKIVSTVAIEKDLIKSEVLTHAKDYMNRH